MRGLAWRVTGGAPDLALALDGAGLALWLCAWPLSAALIEASARQARHGGPPGWHWRCRVVTALHLWGASVVLALAPPGCCWDTKARRTCCSWKPWTR